MAILDEIRDRKATVSVTGVALLVALVSIGLQTCATTPKLNRAMSTGLGQMVAAETATAVRGHGQIVAVIDVSYTTAGAGHFDEWQAFQHELKKHPGLNLSATPSVEVDPDDSSTGCPSPAFKRLMEEYADVDAIVFFISLPNWNWLRQHQLIPQRLPPHVIVLDTGPLPVHGHYTDYFANGYVSELIAARVAPAPAVSVTPRTPREWFDQSCQVFTPQNYELLADPGGNR